MKRLMIVMMLTSLISKAETETTPDGIVWTYMVKDGEAQIGMGQWDGQAVSKDTSGEILIPTTLGGCPVTRISGFAFNECTKLTGVIIPNGIMSVATPAFNGCSSLEKVTIPPSVTRIEDGAFYGCSGLLSIQVDKANTIYISEDGVLYDDTEKKLICYPAKRKGHATILDGVKSIGVQAFGGCVGLTSVTIPSSVKCIGDMAFSGCSGLTSVVIPSSVESLGGSVFYFCTGLNVVEFMGSCPSCGTYMFAHANEKCVVRVPVNSVGWSGAFSMALPTVWQDREIVHSQRKMDWNEFWSRMGFQCSSANVVNVSVTNVVVQYVLNSVQPQFALPATSDTGFVNIITEVKGGAVSVPSTWVEDYPEFVSKFGSDFTKALTMKTGKKDGAGNDMFVWQDYVAGTDPTKPEDKFTASITVVEGKVTVSYTPELDEARKTLRKYMIWGKQSLMEKDWVEVAEGREADYNFFKVTVEMR